MSTAMIVLQADTALKASFYAAVRRLSVHGSDDALIISGRVESYYFKQIAQEAVMQLRGNLRLENQVDVVRAG
jgi:osmotically-inducible protein OsmY